MATNDINVNTTTGMFKLLMADKLSKLGTGRRQPSDQFFADGDILCRADKREGVVEIDDEELCHRIVAKFPCSYFGCTLEFDSMLQFEMHYNTSHRYCCSECKKHLPSPHLLDLHISETHDSFFLAQSQRKPMYLCYVEECSFLFSSPQERRIHCIECHQFPHNFRFDGTKKKNKTKSRVKSVHSTMDVELKLCESGARNSSKVETETNIAEVMQQDEGNCNVSEYKSNVQSATKDYQVGARVYKKRFSFGRGQSISMKIGKNRNNLKSQMNENEMDASSSSDVWRTSELMEAVEDVVGNSFNIKNEIKHSSPSDLPVAKPN